MTPRRAVVEEVVDEPWEPPAWRSERHEELVAEGWQRRFVAAPPRLDEMLELYRSLGLEVRAEPVYASDPAGHCSDCLAARALFRVVYTREKRA